mmetsp:Transcript_26094/g.85740  ORF Transcript_26094/g.85740 Transcript_26094/m.85740 type:complete len:253 (-) Transcript_26094:742-1500(-)
MQAEMRAHLRRRRRSRVLHARHRLRLTHRQRLSLVQVLNGDRERLCSLYVRRFLLLLCPRAKHLNRLHHVPSLVVQTIHGGHQPVLDEELAVRALLQRRDVSQRLVHGAHRVAVHSPKVALLDVHPRDERVLFEDELRLDRLVPVKRHRLDVLHAAIGHRRAHFAPDRLSILLRHVSPDAKVVNHLVRSPRVRRAPPLVLPVRPVVPVQQPLERAQKRRLSRRRQRPLLPRLAARLRGDQHHVLVLVLHLRL